MERSFANTTISRLEYGGRVLVAWVQMRAIIAAGVGGKVRYLKVRVGTVARVEAVDLFPSCRHPSTGHV